jgi:hypothetical protein
MRMDCPCAGPCTSSLGPKLLPWVPNRGVNQARSSLTSLHHPEQGHSPVLVTANRLAGGLSFGIGVPIVIASIR